MNYHIICETTQKPSINIYLRILALFFLYGAIVHYANLLGFGEMPWVEAPLSWQIGDIVYAILDTVAVIGLWNRTTWGIGFFLLAAISQLILYLGFPHLFAFTPEQKQALWSIVIFHSVTVSIFFGLLFTTKEVKDVQTLPELLD
ncbi:MAG: DUF6163 family protein [Nostocaceae cyanobacterium]|nr:DUF6163 family protein [Nostocaceae cyanobacterium]